MHKSYVYVKMKTLPFDVYVPSKGRPNGRTFDMLRRSKIAFTVFIESSDEYTYRDIHPGAEIVILPKSNRGIGYAREFIRSYAERPFVMIDDDITKIYRRTMDGAIRACSLHSALMFGWHAYSSVCDTHGILGFKHSTYNLPRPDHTITYDTTIAHIVYMNPTDDIHYNSKLKAFEDIDVMFKHRLAQMPIVRINTIIYFTTPSGTNKVGGIDYTHVRKEHELKKLADRYPTWIRQVPQKKAQHDQIKYEITWSRRKTM